MRTFGCVIAALLLLAAPGVTQEGGFQVPATLGPPIDPATTDVTATDVVVTDADGRVLECWRGDFKPGEVVRLGSGRLPLAHALPWELLRLRPDRGLSKFYRNIDDLRHAWGKYWVVRSWGWNWDPLPPSPSLPMYFWPTTTDGAEADLRLVLFLRKEAVAGLPTIWLPATAVVQQKLSMVSYVSAEPAPGSGAHHFTDDVALIESGRVVAPRKVWQRYGDSDRAYSTELTAATLAEFKAATMRYKVVDIPARELPRRWADFGPLVALPPLRP